MLNWSLDPPHRKGHLLAFEGVWPIEIIVKYIVLGWVNGDPSKSGGIVRRHSCCPRGLRFFSCFIGLPFFSCKPVPDRQTERQTNTMRPFSGRAMFTRQRHRSRRLMPQQRRSAHRISLCPRYFSRVQTSCLVPETAPVYRQS